MMPGNQKCSRTHHTHGTTFAAWRIQGKVAEDLPCDVNRLERLCDCRDEGHTRCQGHPCFCWIEAKAHLPSTSKEIQTKALKWGCSLDVKCPQGFGRHKPCCVPNCCKYLYQPPGWVGPFRNNNKNHLRQVPLICGEYLEPNLIIKREQEHNK